MPKLAIPIFCILILNQLVNYLSIHIGSGTYTCIILSFTIVKIVFRTRRV